jgi:hypothetical protein
MARRLLQAMNEQ